MSLYKGFHKFIVKGVNIMTMEQITTGVTDLMGVMGTVLTSIGSNAALMVIFCVGVVGAGAGAFKKIARSVK
jgi:hypothetical protein